MIRTCTQCFIITFMKTIITCWWIEIIIEFTNTRTIYSQVKSIWYVSIFFQFQLPFASIDFELIVSRINRVIVKPTIFILSFFKEKLKHFIFIDFYIEINTDDFISHESEWFTFLFISRLSEIFFSTCSFSFSVSDLDKRYPPDVFMRVLMISLATYFINFNQ